MPSPRLVGGLAALVAILTLPVGLLTALFVGFEAAAVVFVVGWFALTPLIPIVGHEVGPHVLARYRSGDEADEDGADDEADDPLAELKRRYAKGEIGDEEFERRVERLVAVDDRDPAVPSEAGSAPDAVEPDRPRSEPERERE